MTAKATRSHEEAGLHDPRAEHLPRWPALQKARAEFRRFDDQLRALGLYEAERSNLRKILRRRAALAGSLSHLSVQGWWGGVLLLVLACSLGFTPVAVASLIGVTPNPTGWLVIYVAYLPAFLVTLVALTILAAFTVNEVGENREWWTRAAVLLSSAAPIVLLSLYVSYAQDSPSKLHVIAISAVAAAAIHVYLLGTSLGLDYYVKKRRLGSQTPNEVACCAFFDELHQLVASRREWRRRTKRKELVRSLGRAAQVMSISVEQAVRSSGGDANARRWAVVRAWHAAEALRSHQRGLMQASSQAQYEQIVADLRKQVIELGHGSWSAVQQPTEAVPAAETRRRFERFMPAVVLVALAAGLPYVPGLKLTDATLTTLRIGLLIPSLLSLMPVQASNRDFVAASFRDVLGKVGKAP